MPEASPLIINGWTVYLHPLFMDQVDVLKRKVQAQQQKDPQHYQRKPAYKQLQAILRLVLHVIPQDPTLPEYRQGNTLGPEYRHWFRAKFFQQYRLFFRYHAESRIIVLAWVNDNRTLRAYDSDVDAYRVFRKMLHSGHPPDDWESLLAAAMDEAGRLSGFSGAVHDGD